LVHVLPQTISDWLVHLQVPLSHVVPPGQTVPQDPQLEESLWVSVQAPPQCCPFWHRQINELEQYSVAESHLVSQEPQKSALWGFTHEPLHSKAHWHVPLLHVRVPSAQASLGQQGSPRFPHSVEVVDAPPAPPLPVLVVDAPPVPPAPLPVLVVDAPPVPPVPLPVLVVDAPPVPPALVPPAPPLGVLVPPAPPLGVLVPPAPPLGVLVPPAPPLGVLVPPAPPPPALVPPAPPLGVLVPPAPPPPALVPPEPPFWVLVLDVPPAPPRASTKSSRPMIELHPAMPSEKTPSAKFARRKYMGRNLLHSRRTRHFIC
jgi:hypothetical protein